MRKGTSSRAHYFRPEPIGFAGMDVCYEIDGNVIMGWAGTFEDPPEDPEITVLSVRRLNPLDNQYTDLNPSDWPFTEDEFREIERRLLSEL